jgi:hypothetical protein
MVGMKQDKAPEGSQSKGPFCGLCPFCGEPIAESPLDPCSVTVTTRSGTGQSWKVHAACFKGKIVSHSYLDLSPTHF